jgi:hypothetical protein
MRLLPKALWHGSVCAAYGFKIPNPYCARVGILSTLALPPGAQPRLRMWERLAGGTAKARQIIA